MAVENLRREFVISCVSKLSNHHAQFGSVVWEALRVDVCVLPSVCGFIVLWLAGGLFFFIMRIIFLL